MEKRNYWESLEKDREEISTDSKLTPSRRVQRQSSNQKSQKRKNVLLPLLFFIFILIPVTILIYVAFVYEPNDTEIGAKNENEVSVENIKPTGENALILPEEAEEVPEEKDGITEVQPKEEDVKTEEKVEEIVKEEVTKEPKEIEKSEEPAAQQTPPQETPSSPERVEPAASETTGAKTVRVKDNETLYRIAVNNYGASGAGAAVEKIKQANGLTSNEILVGQKLILP